MGSWMNNLSILAVFKNCTLPNSTVDCSKHLSPIGVGYRAVVERGASVRL